MSKEATRSYKVSLNKVMRHAGMHRQGEYFTSGESKVLELTDKQAEVYENDRLFTITESTDDEKAKDEGGDDGAGDAGKPATGTDAGADAGSEDKGDEVKTGDEAKEAGSEDAGDKGEGGDTPPTTQPLTVDELLRTNNRDALVEQAKAAKLELNFDDQQATTKKVIAEALVAAQTPKTGE